MIPKTFLNRPFLPLATERLTLRLLEKSDRETIARLANNIEIAKKLARLPHPYGLKDADKFIAFAQEGIAKGTHVVFAITRRSDQQFMGLIGLEGENELGYWLAPEFWGQGYGFEAARDLVNFAFTFLEIDEIKGSALDDNPASKRIFEKIGFHERGSKQATSVAYEGTKPAKYYLMTKEDHKRAMEESGRPVMLAAAAALVKDDKILISERVGERAYVGTWELPGGKLEQGESAIEAIIRELQEELEILVRPEDITPFTSADYFYEKFNLVMPIFLCENWEGTPHGAEGQRLRWVEYDDFSHIAIPPASIPSIHQIGDFLGEMKANPKRHNSKG